MKKIIIVLIILLVFILSIEQEEKKEKELRGVFISYIELSKYVKTDINTSKNNIKKMIKNIKDFNLNTIILQVRISSDSIYKSNIYPTSNYIVENEGDKFYDVLDFFLKEAHKNDIKLFAWINPYRVRTTEDINTISKSNPAYKYLNTDYIYINNGVYYNPSKSEVTKLIVEGVEEVLDYPVDGVLFDDYFYPNNEIDLNDYNEYLKDNKKISKEEYNLNIINNMVEKVYSKCKSKNIYFGISPEGNISNNYNKNYADVKRWINSNKYIDFIMPQIYYGFNNSVKNYKDTIKEWEYLNKKDLYIALSFYKVGYKDIYAKEGMDEWINSNDLIMRQVILARNLKRYKGFVIFRYDNIFDKNSYRENSVSEINNLKRILK